MWRLLAVDLLALLLVRCSAVELAHKKVSDVKTSPGFVAVDETKSSSFEDGVAHADSLTEEQQGHGTDEEEDVDMGRIHEMIMKRIDIDNNGLISWNEAVEHAKSLRLDELEDAKQNHMSESKMQELVWDAASEAQLKKQFEVADADKDGQLSITELPDAMVEEEEQVRGMEANEEEEEDEEEEDPKEEHDEEGEEEEGEEKEKDEPADEEEDEAEHQPVSLLELGEDDLEDGDSGHFGSGDEEDEDEVEKQEEEDRRKENKDQAFGSNEVQSMLKAADTDADGGISLHEALKFFRHEGASAADDATIKAEFKFADKNGDGIWDEHELANVLNDIALAENDHHEDSGEGRTASFVEVHGDNHRGHKKVHGATSSSADLSSEMYLSEVFDVMDAAGSGHIKWSDLSHRMEKAQESKTFPKGVDTRKLQAYFKSVDTNKDGLINSKEWTNYSHLIAQDLGSDAKALMPQLLAVWQAE